MPEKVCTWLICSNKYDVRFEAAIASCLTHDIPDTEILVVCNGPNAESIAQDVRSRFGVGTALVVFATPITQLIFSLNLGVHHARGMYIARMDADDIAYPARLGAQLAFMEANPDVVVCGTDYDLIDECDQAIRRVIVPRSDAKIRSRLVWSNPFCHPTTMMRRSAIVGAGGYWGGVHAEDYDLWVRLSQVPGYRFANLPFPGIGYRAKSQGQARGARSAYASAASTQFRCFITGHGWRWGVAALSTTLKAVRRTARQRA